MKYICPLLAVKNMEASKRFYQDVLGLSVVNDFGANVTLTGGIALQTLDSWKSLIGTDRVTLQSHGGELYFEENDLDAFCRRLTALSVPLVHPLITHRWGQRAVRFYDPDGHIIEVGEGMDAVARRFAEDGLSPEDAAKRMDAPLSFVMECLKK